MKEPACCCRTSLSDHPWILRRSVQPAFKSISTYSVALNWNPHTTKLHQTKQNAIAHLSKFGEPYVYEVRTSEDLAMKKPAGMLIQVDAASINAHDVIMALGRTKMLQGKPSLIKP
jgi:hypothetical protein